VEHRWDDAAAGGDEFERLVYAARLLGDDPDLARHGGGNVSLKRQGTDLAGRPVDLLWVKAAGTPLCGITPAGFTAVRLADFRALAASPAPDDAALVAFLSAARLDPRSPLPTVETPLHAGIPHPCVLHTHDLPTLALSDTPRKDALVREAWGDEVAYVGYVRPGHPLSRTALGLSGLDKVRGLVLGKHGLVTWGETVRDAYDRLHALLAKARNFLERARRAKNPLAKQRHSPGDPSRRGAAARAVLPMLRGMLGRLSPVVLHLDDSEDARCFADSELAKQIHRRGMATPEHILRCGRMPCYVDATIASFPPEEAVPLLRSAVAQFEDDVRQSFRKHGRGGEPRHPLPRIVILPGLGIVAAGPDARAAEAAARGYHQVVRVIELAEAADQFRVLEEASSFEYEHYYPMEVAPRAVVPELEGRIAVVTGAARGIGRAIAARFAREGAHLVITDVDGPGLEEARAEAAAAGDPTRVRAVVADATDEASTARDFDEAVSAFGGLDILVSNAGVVRPAPVEAYSEAAWERHFDVNVKGS
jgi:rhamnose utilization protein RhaD (predicted bifunctional aldolase and dehydrogenase)